MGLSRADIFRIHEEILKKPDLTTMEKNKISARTNRLLRDRGDDIIHALWHDKREDRSTEDTIDNSFVGKIIKPKGLNIGDITQVDPSHLGGGIAEMIARQQGRGHRGNNTKH